MKFKVITLFPEFINRIKEYSVISRAIKNSKIKLETINIRDFGLGNYKQVDDRPYGGGVGMLLRVDVMYKALKKASPRKSAKRRVILLSADGEQFSQKIAHRLLKYDEIVLVCAHYEGHDKRVEEYVDEKISIGPYVLTGGEIPAMTIIDATSRLISGVLGKDESSKSESFSIDNNEKTLEYPQYTRPFDFEGKKVPEVLLCGDHKKIKKWKEDNTRTV
ncbi:MAG: tRNA (guanosine(37)-N1)-methyltransferase TrmD [bacterium]